MPRDFTFNLVLNAAMQGNLFHTAEKGSEKLNKLGAVLTDLREKYASNSAALQNAVAVQQRASVIAGRLTTAHEAGKISQSAYSAGISLMAENFKQASVAAEDYSKKMREIAAQQRTASSQQASMKFNDSAGKTVGAYQNMRGAVDTAKSVAAPLTSAIETAMNFESAMAKVGAISIKAPKGSEEYESQLQKLTAEARHLGSTTQFSASQAAEAMSYLGMAGWNTSQIIGGMPGLLGLAGASGTALATVADIVSDDLTAFGLAASDAGHMADVFSYVITNTNTDVSMLGETMKYAAPVAKAFGASMEETAAMAGIMANSGIKASQAGTSLRAGFLRLAGPPKAASKEMSALGIDMQQAATEAQEAQQALAALGITTQNVGGGQKKMGTILQELRTKTANLSQEQKIATLGAIFGTNAVTGWLAVLDSSPEVFDKMVNEMEHCDGLAAEMNQKMMDNAKGGMVQFQSALESVAISIGSVFLPAIAGQMKSLAALAGNFSAWAEDHPLLIKGVTGIGAAVTMATVGFFALGTAINGLKTAGAAIDLVSTKMVVLESRMTQTAMANTVLSTRMSMIATTFSGFSSSVGTFGSLLLGKVLGPFKMLGGLLGTAGGKMTSGISGVLSSIITKIAPFGSMLINVLGKPFAMIGRLVAPLAGMLAGPLTTAFGGVIASFGGLAAAALPVIGIIAGIVAIGAILYNNWNTIANVAEVVYNKVAGCWDAAMQRLQPAFDSIGQSIDRLGITFSTFGGNSSILEAVFNTLGSVIAGTFMVAITVVETFVVGFSGALDTISTVINEVGVAIQAFASGDWASAWNSMGDIVSTVVNGIISTVSNMISSVTSGIQSILGLGGGGGGGSSGAEVASNAEGGIYRQGAFLTTFAEKSPEAAIPIDGSQRAIELWKQAGRMLGQPVVGGDGSVSSLSAPSMNEQMNTVSSLSGQLSGSMLPNASNEGSIFSLNVPSMSEQTNTVSPLSGQLSGSMLPNASDTSNNSSVIDSLKGMLHNITEGNISNTTNNNGGNSSNQTISINIPVTINGNADESTVVNMQNNIVDIVRRAMADIQNQQRRVSFA